MTSTTERVFSGDLGLRPTRSGRHNDSSSSRESSPDSDAGKRKRKRSFSPGSDFGEPEVPPVAQDDTPPPQERPLIRQAVGFGSAFAPSVAPPSSSIYQEPVSITPNAPLLPGQFLEVVKPPPKKTTSKKKKKADPYAGQSGRFRLEAYDATPAGAPPTQSGAGPYSSSFRATQPPAHRSESPAVPMEPYRYASTASETIHTQSERSISPPAPKPSRGSNKSKDSAKSRNRTTTQSQSRQPYVDAHTHTRVPSTTPAPASITDHGPSPPPPPSSGSRNTHYRRDYETGRKLQPSDLLEPTSGPSRSGRQSHSSSSPDLPTSSVPTSPNPNRGHSEGSNGNRKKQRNVKLVTIFAQDIRSGVVDEQLIEVMVPLRPPPDPSDGWFADAKDLIEQWQKSPSRIDGPARVYTMRGKYRQMLLRVSDSNVDDYTSTNVLVNGKLEVNVVIEDLPTPGQRPARPQVPLDLRPDDYEQDMRPPFPQPDVPPPRQQHHHDSARTGQPAYRRNDRDRQAQLYGSERYYDGPGPSGSSNQNTPSRSNALPIGYRREEQTPSRSRHSPPASYHPEPSTPSRIRYSPPVPDREHHEKDPPFHARDLPPGPKEQPERNATPARPTRQSPPNSHREQDFQNIPTRPRREPLSDSRQGETIQPVPSARIVADVRSPEAGPSSAPPTNVSSDQLPVSAPLPEPQSYDLRGIARKPKKGWESPIPGDAPEKVEEAILKAVDSMIQKDDKEKWKAFFKLKTRQETAANMVSMYQFVQDLIDKYVGLPVPFSSTSDHIMKTNHIIKVLMVEDEDGRYASNCEETLKLLRLYGKGGSRYEDPEALKLLEETEVAYNSKPIKRLLHMLQNVDQRWKAEHPRT